MALLRWGNLSVASSKTLWALWGPPKVSLESQGGASGGTWDLWRAKAAYLQGPFGNFGGLTALMGLSWGPLGGQPGAVLDPQGPSCGSLGALFGLSEPS